MPRAGLTSVHTARPHTPSHITPRTPVTPYVVQRTGAGEGRPRRALQQTLSRPQPYLCLCTHIYLGLGCNMARVQASPRRWDCARRRVVLVSEDWCTPQCRRVPRARCGLQTFAVDDQLHGSPQLTTTFLQAWRTLSCRDTIAPRWCGTGRSSPPGPRTGRSYRPRPQLWAHLPSWWHPRTE